MNNQNGKVRALYRYSRSQSANELPYVQKGFFYIFLLENDWSTLSTRVFNDNKDKFINELGGHIFVEPTTESQKDELRKLFHSKEEMEPLLIICEDHPSMLSQSINSNNGLKISFATLKDEQSVIKVLRFIVTEINDENFLKKLKWKDRVIHMREKLKGIPIVDLIGFFVGL